MFVYLALIENDRDKLVFEGLYYEYKNLMFFIAKGILKNDRDAEDAVHEAFVSLAENFYKIPKNNTHKTRAFFIVVVERKAINMYNRSKLHLTIGFDERAEGMELPAPGKGMAAEAMSRLPVKYKELIYLKHFCGFKSKEIAKMMNMSDDMVRRSLSDARAAYREELRKEGIDV